MVELCIDLLHVNAVVIPVIGRGVGSYILYVKQDMCNFKLITHNFIVAYIVV